MKRRRYCRGHRFTRRVSFIQLTFIKDVGRAVAHTVSSEVKMMSDSRNNMLDVSTVAALIDLVAVAPAAIVSRVLARTSGGSVTLFAFAAGQELSEHTAPFDALVQVVDGRLEITIAGKPLSVGPSEVVVMPANVPHALRATEDSRMILTMLREVGEGV